MTANKQLYRSFRRIKPSYKGEGIVMIILNLTAEVDEEWTDEEGLKEMVVVKIQGVVEPIVTLPVYWRSSHSGPDVARTVADWLREKLS